MSEPRASSPLVRLRMQATRGTNNQLERTLRSVLHAKGYRFRIHYRVSQLPRRSIDVALVGKRVAIFIDGCFWHGCTVHGTLPKANGAWWKKKIETNRQRDKDTTQKLVALGWRVIRAWEHEPLEQIIKNLQKICPLP